MSLVPAEGASKDGIIVKTSSNEATFDLPKKPPENASRLDELTDNTPLGGRNRSRKVIISPMGRMSGSLRPERSRSADPSRASGRIGGILSPIVSPILMSPSKFKSPNTSEFILGSPTQEDSINESTVESIPSSGKQKSSKMASGSVALLKKVKSKSVARLPIQRKSTQEISNLQILSEDPDRVFKIKNRFTRKGSRPDVSGSCNAAPDVPPADDLELKQLTEIQKLASKLDMVLPLKLSPVVKKAEVWVQWAKKASCDDTLIASTNQNPTLTDTTPTKPQSHKSATTLSIGTISIGDSPVKNSLSNPSLGNHALPPKASHPKSSATPRGKVMKETKKKKTSSKASASQANKKNNFSGKLLANTSANDMGDDSFRNSDSADNRFDLMSSPKMGSTSVSPGRDILGTSPGFHSEELDFARPWKHFTIEVRAHGLVFNADFASKDESEDNHNLPNISDNWFLLKDISVVNTGESISSVANEIGDSSFSYLLLLFPASSLLTPRMGTTSPKEVFSQPMAIAFRSSAERDEWYNLLSALIAQRRPVLKDFALICPIGKGASGSVFLVRDLVFKDFLALKVMDKAAVFESSSSYRHTVTEKVVHDMCSNSTFFSQLRYAFQSKNALYIATKFYEGADLFYYAQRQSGYLSEDQLVLVVAQIILGLEELHSKGILYRDLKPENILLDSNFNCYIADFGLAKILGTNPLIKTYTMCGTLAYVSPEMAERQGYTFSCDLWTLGVFVYSLLFSSPPFCHSNLEDVSYVIDETELEFPDVSEEAASFVSSLLIQDVDMRLGCGPIGLDEVKNHPFLNDVDWDGIRQRKIYPHSLKNYLIEPDDLEVDTKEFLLRNFEIEGEDFSACILNFEDEINYDVEHDMGISLDGSRNSITAADPAHLCGFFFNSNLEDRQENVILSRSRPSAVSRLGKKITRTFKKLSTSNVSEAQ